MFSDFSLPYYLFIPFTVGFAAQFTKFFISIVRKEFSWSYLNSYGGFPSAHTAFTTSMAAVAFLADGLNSVTFALALVFATVVVRDALGIRVFVSQQSAIINRLVKERNEKSEPGVEDDFPFLKERLGHKIGEVAGGAIYGFVLTIFLYWWLVDKAVLG